MMMIESSLGKIFLDSNLVDFKSISAEACLATKSYLLSFGYFYLMGFVDVYVVT